ncbi:MAG: pilus assembly protein PilM, partial [Planctomycetota bacterium]
MLTKESLDRLAKTSVDILNKASLNVLSRTSVGMYISDESIELALLRQTKDGVKLVEAASEPIPPGAVSNGVVKDPAILTKAVKNLKNRYKIGAQRTVVSLFARPVLTQIMDLPEDLPANIGQYVRKEVKHCAVLPSRNISLDYCGVPSQSRSGAKRVLVVATENEKVLRLIKALNEAGLNVEAVEPAELACARALYEKEIAPLVDSNVLVALVEGADITLTVFQNQTLDFIRRRNVAEDICQSKEGLARFTEEISAIIQYYNIEIGEKS